MPLYEHVFLARQDASSQQVEELTTQMTGIVEGLGGKVTKTENGVNPLFFGQTALLGCDVWEHSYYIDFRNKRPAYLTNFLEKLVNWEAVAAKL